MKAIKIAYNLTIANIILFAIALGVGIIDHFVDGHHFQDPSPLCGISWLLFFLSILLGSVSWIYNLIIVCKNKRSKFVYWLNIILTIVAGYYLFDKLCPWIFERYRTLVELIVENAAIYYNWSNPVKQYFGIQINLLVNCFFLAIGCIQYIMNSIVVIMMRYNK